MGWYLVLRHAFDSRAPGSPSGPLRAALSTLIVSARRNYERHTNEVRHLVPLGRVPPWAREVRHHFAIIEEAVWSQSQPERWRELVTIELAPFLLPGPGVDLLITPFRA